MATLAGTDVDIDHGGRLRKDLPAGEIRQMDFLDAYPFVDDVFVEEMSRAQIRQALE